MRKYQFLVPPVNALIRIITLACGLLMVSVTVQAAGAVPPRPRVALLELVIEGDASSPALSMQLQDGFVLSLVTGGVDVVDAVDIARRLAGTPELQKCETSPCLKQLGQQMGVRHALRVRVQTTGNNYRMTVRVFSTEGAAPAALPLSTKTRPCDVCTAKEAREVMMRLADDVRPLLEERIVVTVPPPAPPAPKPSSLAPILLTTAGVAAILVGAALVHGGAADSKRGPTFGGALAGLGFAGASMGLYLAFPY